MHLAYTALPAIYDISSSERNWVPTLDAIVRATAARGALIFGTEQTDLDYSVARASTFFDDKAYVAGEFMSSFGKYDAEGRDYLFQRPKFSVISDYDIWPGENIFDREDFTYQRKHLGTFLRAGVNLSPDHGWKAGLIVHFPATVRQIPDDARSPLSFLAPHLAKSLEIRRFVSGLVARYKLVLSVLDKVRIGLCVSDASGEVLIANKKAERIIAQTPGLFLDRSKRLVVRDETLAARLGDAISVAARIAQEIGGKAGTSFHIPSSDHCREPLFLEVSPVRDGDGEFAAGFSGALITLIDSNDPPSLPSATLSLLCGLTSAEDAVASLLLQGHPIDKIADRRAVSVNTVKSQAKMIYSKSRVASRGELIRKAAHLNPPID